MRAFPALLVSTSVLAQTPPAASEPGRNEAVHTTIEAHHAELQRCLSIDHGLASGTLKVFISIDRDGHVSGTRIGHASKNAEIDRCIATAIERFTFPEPANGRPWVAVYPFRFAASKEQSPETLTEQQIDKAVMARDAEISACYTTARAEHPDFVAYLDLIVVVNAQGHVTDVRIRATTSAASAFDACVVARMKTVEFPAPSDGMGTSFVYPLGFSP